MVLTDIYKELQKLKIFISFLGSLDFASDADIKNIELIKNLIESINDTKTHKTWNACLDIYDNGIIDSLEKREGVYWRCWAVWAKKGSIEIEARSRHSSLQTFPFLKDYYYHTIVALIQPSTDNFVGSMDAFLADAKTYKKYVTETLNDVKLDISIG